MKLSELLQQYKQPFEKTYGHRLLPSHRKAMNSILECRTPDAGEMIVQCPDCGRFEWRPKSCGNRNCPGCQNHETSVWLNRQQSKLLPVPYFLVTFTVPASLRKLAWHNQRVFFSCLFDASADTLRALAGNERFLGGNIGMTGVLHTNSRQLDFHPHIHYIVPAGAVEPENWLWKRSKGKFLFPQRALTRIFRARLVALLRSKGLRLPEVFARGDWVVHCQYAGSGAPALKYLARYLYRGVIAEKRIIRNKDGLVTFLWRESKTKKWRRKTMPGQHFLWLVLQHTLPCGFRRVRDYGFLHGNSRRLLTLIQLLLNARPVMTELPERPVFKCPDCGTAMAIRGFRQRGYFNSRSPPAEALNLLN
ncbi:MAG: transposase [Candidatus Riflebacteria bacterium]|nr:transposase [Candidatus Riflebacteria bacterium]